MSKALEHCQSAIALDYGSLPSVKDAFPSRSSIISADYWNDETIFSKLRPLDRHLLPMAHRLQVRLAPYAKYERAEDQVTLLLQQLKERKNKLVQADLLNQCVSLLTEALDNGMEANEQAKTVDLRRKPERVPIFKGLSLEAIEVILTQSHPNGVINVTLLERYHLIFAMMKHAQTLGMLEIIEICGSYILSFKWDATVADDGTKDFISIQSESYFLLAESLAERIATSKIENHQGNFDERADYDPRALGISHPLATEDMLKLKSLVILTIQRGE